MPYTATHRFARISDKKARPMARLIQGMTVSKALEALEFNPRRSAKMIEKVLRSAVANAGAGADAKDLYVSSVRIDGGPVAVGTKRFIPVSRGMAHPIRKRTSHIKVTVDNIKTEEER